MHIFSIRDIDITLYSRLRKKVYILKQLKKNIPFCPASKAGQKGGTFINNIITYRSAYLLILPAILQVLFIHYLPFAGITIAFKDFDIVDGIMRSPWVGFDNFKTIFTQPKMLHAVWNSLKYGLVIVFLAFPFPIFLALLFNELKNAKLKKVVQTISYMPHFISWIAVVGLFYTIFATEGTFNSLMLSIMGDKWEPRNILFDADNFTMILFVSHIWKTIGWSSVIFLAAIAGIDPTLYEAACVDGCGKLKQVFHITIPSIASTVIIVLVMSLASIFQVSFEQIYSFQNVYTQEATDAINTVIYRQGIQGGKYSLATAFGLSQGLVTVTLLLVSNFASKKIFDIGIW